MEEGGSGRGREGANEGESEGWNEEGKKGGESRGESEESQEERESARELLLSYRVAAEAIYPFVVYIWVVRNNDGGVYQDF